MADKITYTHTFGGLSSPIPLSYLDANFTDVSDALASLNSFGNFYVDTGGVNAYAITLATGQTHSLAAGLPVQVKIANSNTGVSTLSINGGPATPIRIGSAALIKDDLQAGFTYSLQYDGTQFQLLTQIPKIGSFTPVANAFTVIGTPTYSGTYTKIGNRVFGEIRITSTTSVAATAGVSYFTGLPYDSAHFGTCTAAQDSGSSGFISGLVTSGVGAGIYVPAWAATNGINVAFSYGLS